MGIEKHIERLKEGIEAIEKELKEGRIKNKEDMPKNASYKIIFSWENIKPESKRVLLFKRLFGYKAEKKEYSGLLKQYKGEKLGKGIIIVPAKYSDIFINIFREMKITVNIRKIVEYS